jgi:glycosyltransferase involved in cell wall biosynthesis
MKLLIVMKKFSGGPKVFRKRLSDVLEKRAAETGIEIVHDPNGNFDAELAFVRNLTQHRKPTILRVDGCYLGGGYEQKNLVYKESAKKAKFIIYQSDFSSKMCESIWGIKRPSTVISNGINFDEIKHIYKDPTVPKGSFVASAIWRKNKRPVSMIQGFIDAGVKNHFYVIGDTYGIPPQYLNKFRKHKNIHFLGTCDFERSISVFKSCDYQLHLSQIESCPNAVIEGLACGLKILYSNLQGTKEIVPSDSGVMIKTDKWDFKPIGLGQHDRIKPGLVADGIHRLMALKGERKMYPSEIDINKVADKYIKVIKENV